MLKNGLRRFSQFSQMMYPRVGFSVSIDNLPIESESKIYHGAKTDDVFDVTDGMVNQVLLQTRGNSFTLLHIYQYTDDLFLDTERHFTKVIGSFEKLESEVNYLYPTSGFFRSSFSSNREYVGKPTAKKFNEPIQVNKNGAELKIDGWKNPFIKSYAVHMPLSPITISMLCRGDNNIINRELLLKLMTTDFFYD